jgi:hypothetical protein
VGDVMTVVAAMTVVAIGGFLNRRRRIGRGDRLSDLCDDRRLRGVRAAENADANKRGERKRDMTHENLRIENSGLT